jgi:hypothetical protein
MPCLGTVVGMGVTALTLELILVVLMMQCAPSCPRPGAPAAGAVGRRRAEVPVASQLPGVQTGGSAAPTSCPRLEAPISLFALHVLERFHHWGEGWGGSVVK